jgi:hypothetical protein
VTAGTIREWRGIKTFLSRCGNNGFVSMVAQSVIITRRIEDFADELRRFTDPSRR